MKKIIETRNEKKESFSVRIRSIWVKSRSRFWVSEETLIVFKLLPMITYCNYNRKKKLLNSAHVDFGIKYVDRAKCTAWHAFTEFLLH